MHGKDRTDHTAVVSGSNRIRRSGVDVSRADPVRGDGWKGDRHVPRTEIPQHLAATYDFTAGNSAVGIDFPDVGVDMKVTAVTQPQSSCPFKSARQKIFGIGYALLVFVYDKKDDPKTNTAVLNILHALFVEERRTADFTMTRLIRQHLETGCNAEDLIGLMHDKNLPVDDIEANKIAAELLLKPCEQGFLTISNALQWRLQYSRAIAEAGGVDGILRLR